MGTISFLCQNDPLLVLVLESGERWRRRREQLDSVTVVDDKGKVTPLRVD